MANLNDDDHFVCVCAGEKSLILGVLFYFILSSPAGKSAGIEGRVEIVKLYILIDNYNP